MTAGHRLSLRILVVAGREPWPLNSGGRLRLYNFLRWLARDADVTLALPGPAQHAAELPPELRLLDMSATPLNSRSTSVPPRNWVMHRVRQHFGHNPVVSSWLARHARPGQYDVALLYGAVTGQYVDAIRIPTVWDAVDELVLYTLRDAAWRGPRHWLKAARAAMLYAAFERNVARRARFTVYASSVDASYARRWAGGARVVTISNGVDFDYFQGGEEAPERGVIAFVGALNFPPNVEAVFRFSNRVWPRLHNGHRDRRFLIVGREPVPEVQRLSHLDGVEIHADVPDVRPYLTRATAIVVPTRLGGGVKNKVLEACAMGRAVVASQRALAGLTARRGSDVLCAANAAGWIRHVSHLLNSPDKAETLGQSGRKWVRQAHDWPSLARRLASLLTSAAVQRHDRQTSPTPDRHTGPTNVVPRRSTAQWDDSTPRKLTAPRPRSSRHRQEVACH